MQYSLKDKKFEHQTNMGISISHQNNEFNKSRLDKVEKIIECDCVKFKTQ